MARANKHNILGTVVIVVAGIASIATSRVDDDPPPSAADAGLVDTDAAVSEASYSAHAVIGALDRIRIVKNDFANDICYGLGLVYPGTSGTLGIQVPDGWDVEFAYATLGATSCDEQVPVEPIFGISGDGVVRFDAGTEIYPEMLTIDARVVFNDERLPVRIDLEAVDLTVE
jgi:hypothetical protein